LAYILRVRVLVACDQCKRQYDSGAIPAGAFFHCRCGAKVRVPRVAAQDAAVVRCSSCGGPRAQGELACRYCHANFTLREQDLETMCPACAARVSNRAKFCHHCGVPIVPEELAASDSERPCPACGAGHTLHSRSFGADAISLLECNRCAGIWIAQQAFTLLLDRARAQAALDDPAASGAVHPPQAKAATAGPLYRSCPSCGELMHRANFGKRSGVIVDRCKVHGVWFDAEELERVLAWVRSGGEQRAKKAELAEARPDVAGKFLRDRVERMAKGSDGTYSGPSTFGFDQEDDFLTSFLSKLFGV
jgi:Zn-finger nucleic acid-binding protein